ncbi:MAG: ATP-binding protein [Anaerovoracaceae bacterium]|jgi:two-component system sensor histidine kinase ChiS
MRRIASIILASIIIMASVVGLICINYIHMEAENITPNGILDLSNWNPESRKPIQLNGKWEFYPHIFIDPVQSSFSTEGSGRKYVYVPGDWGEGFYPHGSSNAFGTYRLVIKVPEDRQYGIKTSTIRTSARIFMNGREVASVGRVSPDKSGYMPGSRYKIGFAESVDKEMELVIHVSSFDYRTGGILKPIKFGNVDTLVKQNNRERALDGFAISACLILAIYSFLQWILDSNEKYLLYFSGSAFFMSVYLSTMNEQLIMVLFDYQFFTRVKIQIAMMLLITFCFLKFVQHFFDMVTKNNFVNFLSITLLSMLVFVFNDINRKIYLPIGIVQSLIAIALMASYTYIIWILFRNIKSYGDSKGYILITAASLFSYWLVIMCKMLFELDMGHIPLFLIFSMLLGVTLMMNHKARLNHQGLRELTEKMVAYDRIKDDFLAKTSHELRTPLHVMINLSKLMMEGKKGSLNPSQLEDLIFINSESKRLSRLVDELMDVSSIERGEIKILIGPVNPFHAVQNLMDEMKLLIKDDVDVVMINRIEEDFPPIKADSDRFKQIIYNLLHNAVKFTSCGTITVSASVLEGMAEIKVEDTGKGIEKRHIKSVFESQYKGDDEEKRFHGFGMGLAVVKRLVEIHGGSVWVESQIGKGSCFAFTMPLYEAGDNEHADGAGEEVFPKGLYREEDGPYNNQEYTVLIVDDEPSNIKVLKDLVEGMGCKVLEAGKGEQVFSLLDRHVVDLMILDIMLPDMSGELVCKLVRRDYSMSQLPILVLTASGRVMDMMKSFRYGANDFLQKPADGDELISRIQSLLMMKTAVEQGLMKEYQYFYSQISPHFLYNTLNTIIGLSYKDPEGTRKALYNLSVYLRGKMDLYKKEGLITLDDELELVTAYLEIEKMRYRDRLIIEYKIEEKLDGMIQPLTLQPLVENAVYHSLAVEDRVRVSLSAERTGDDTISIVIEDSGPGMTIEKQREIMKGSGERLGLSNVIKKIDIDRRYSLTIDSEEGRGTRIVVKIPEARKNENCIN